MRNIVFTRKPEPKIVGVVCNTGYFAKFNGEIWYIPWTDDPEYQGHKRPTLSVYKSFPSILQNLGKEDEAKYVYEGNTFQMET